MNIEPLEQNKLHELIISVFGGVRQAARAMGFNRVTVYKWIHGEPVDPRSVERLKRGLEKAEKDLEHIKAHLLP